MSKAVRNSEIKIISIDKINIINPRVRNQRVFEDIAGNISQVGLKRPVTVTPANSNIEGKEYDLVCGQGRIEAYMACGQTEIPAIVIEADEHEALVMSLVENLARRQHRALDLLQGIEILQRQGYSIKEIATKTGLTVEYVHGVLNLMERGEERLLSAVENGQIPVSLAIKIAEGTENEQRALQAAYETGLRGKKLLAAKRLIEVRKRRGKTFRTGGRGPRGKRDSGGIISARDVLKIYQREVDRKRILTRKAEVTNNRLVFVIEALRGLLRENNFKTLLKAEGLATMPKQLLELVEKGAIIHD